MKHTLAVCLLAAATVTVFSAATARAADHPATPEPAVQCLMCGPCSKCKVPEVSAASSSISATSESLIDSVIAYIKKSIIIR